jgi:hypothetical protein
MGERSRKDGGLMADLGCSPNAALAFDFLTGKGLSAVQAAAVVGNLQWESGISPTKSVMDINGLPSRGIAMWQPPRWESLLEFSAGRDPFSLSTQLEFLWHELPSFGLTQLLSTARLEDAVIVFQNSFERPRASLAHTDRRIALAQAALYACPAVSPPPKKTGVTAAAIGALALVGTVGYGVYKALTSRSSAPEPISRLIYPPPQRYEPEPPWRE